MVEKPKGKKPQTLIFGLDVKEEPINKAPKKTPSGSPKKPEEEKKKKKETTTFFGD
jgi:hypothetical protein